MDESINELKEWKSVSYKGEWIMLRKRALLPFAGFAAVCLSFPLLTVEVLGWAIFWAPGIVFKNCYSF